MKRWALPLGVLILLFLPACGALRGLETGGEPWVRSGWPVTESESLVMYFEYVRKLPAAELAKEHDSVRRLYAISQTDFNRVRYAMLLSLSGTASSDDTHALDVLAPLLKNPEAGLHPVAFIVSAQIQEQRHGQELQHREQRRSQELQQKFDALMSLDKELRLEQRRSQELQQKLDALKSLVKELRLEQQHSQELQQKLDALKSLDQSLIERGQGATK
jgi:hypothetical protein